MAVTEYHFSERGNSIPPYLLADIRTSDPPPVQINKLLRSFAPKLGDIPPPYQESGFETASPIGEDARKLLIGYMLSLPNGEGQRLFTQSSNLRLINRYASSHRALEIMYTGPSAIEKTPESLLWSRLFMENIHNSMAVRNRLRIVKREFEEAMRSLLGQTDGQINVLSIAAGSSRGIMESLSTLNGEAPERIKLRMIDKSGLALSDGRKLVETLGIRESADFVKTDYRAFENYLGNGYRPHFVEIAGLTDYLDRYEDKGETVSLLATVGENLVDGGYILYTNIDHNDEEVFTHEIVGWPDMEYRSADKLRNYALQAGFEAGKIKMIREPLGIYNLALVTK